MNQSEMLHQMCHDVLAETDVRAICKNRKLPSQAASSRHLLENLFLSDAGVADTMRALDRTEIALLHLLRGHDKPVDVAFFSHLDPPKIDRWSYPTFTQRFQGVFSKVKDRLVRRGIVLLALGKETYEKKTNMERWQFALPVQFARHLPPLVESAKRLSGEGEWHRDAVREKLKTAVRPVTKSVTKNDTAKNDAAKNDATKNDATKNDATKNDTTKNDTTKNDTTKNDTVEIVNGELRWGDQPYRAERVVEWQKLRWQEETNPAKRRNEAAPYTLPPAEAVLRILAGLDADLWSDADALALLLEIYCGTRIDASSVCESGWRWGLLARQEADNRKWYRPAPPAAADDAPPDRYLANPNDESVIVDLDAVPLEALETLVQISDQRPAPGGQPRLLITPNLAKLGRMADTDAALPLVEWLQKNARAFHQAYETARQRRGKTILHENLLVARVGDLSLKVALEKALGKHAVPLGEEFLAFPSEAAAEVKRLVNQMGHVVKKGGPS